MSSLSLPSSRLTVVAPEERLSLESASGLFAGQFRIEFPSRLEVGLSTGLVAFGLLRNSSIVIGARIIRFEFNCACVISNCSVRVFVLRSSVAAVVISSRVCRTQLDGSGVVGNSAGRVLLKPSGLSAVIVRGVILWIGFDGAVEIGNRAIQVTVFRFLYPASNEVPT